MKILLRVLGTIFAVVALVVSAGGVIRNMSDAADVDMVIAQAEVGKAQIVEMQQAMQELGGDPSEINASLKEIDDLAKNIPSKDAFKKAYIMLAVLGVLSIALIVFQYVSNKKITAVLLGLTVLIGILAIVFSPVMKETLTSGASNRSIAIVAAIPAIAAAITAFFAARMSPKVAIAQ